MNINPNKSLSSKSIRYIQPAENNEAIRRQKEPEKDLFSHEVQTPPFHIPNPNLYGTNNRISLFKLLVFIAASGVFLVNKVAEGHSYSNLSKKPLSSENSKEDRVE